MYVCMYVCMCVCVYVHTHAMSIPTGFDFVDVALDVFSSSAHLMRPVAPEAPGVHTPSELKHVIGLNTPMH